MVPVISHSEPLTAYTNNSLTDFSLNDTEHNQHSLADYRGKVVLINIWASWCHPCIEEIPALQQLKQHFSSRAFEILLVNANEPESRVRQFTHAAKIRLPVLIDKDNTAFDEWGVTILPTSFLVDSKGKVRYQARGNPGWDQADTLKIIEQMMLE